MRQIETFNITRLRNDEDFGFQQQVLAEAKKNKAAKATNETA